MIRFTTPVQATDPKSTTWGKESPTWRKYGIHDEVAP